MDIGIVGLGRIGAALASALTATAVNLHGYDISPEARQHAAELGVHVTDALGTLAQRSRVVITSLPTVAAVRDVLDEIGQVLPTGAIVVETSTCAPTLARDAAAWLAQHGVHFVDCPVSGKPPTMTMLVGGPPGTLGVAEQPLSAVAEDIVYLGRTGAGYTVKLLQQYIKYARFLVAAEALTFAEKHGLDLPDTIHALRASTGARAGLATAEEYFTESRTMIARHAPVATIAKDIELTRVMFQQAGFESPSFTALSTFFLDANSGAFGPRPYPEVVELLPAVRFTEGDPR